MAGFFTFQTEELFVTFSQYLGDGSTTQFDITFSYDDSTTLRAEVDGVPAEFTLINPSRIELTEAPATGAEIEIYRETDVSTPLVDFEDGAIVRAVDLDAAVAQPRSRVEELGSFMDDLRQRTVKVPFGETSPTLPTLAERQGKYLAFDSAGNIVADPGSGDGAGLRDELASTSGATFVGISGGRTLDQRLNDEVNVVDEGADPTGATNATAAFAAASAKINAAGGGRLVIPPGTYTVGQQTFAQEALWAYKPDPIISITNCPRPVEIVGYGAKLVAADGLKYGSYDPVTGEAYYPDSFPFTDYTYRASGYEAMILLTGNASVRVAGVELDGNSPNMALGGGWNMDGWQLPGDGIYAYSNDRLTVVDVFSHHHPLDGIQIGYPGLTDADIKYPHRILSSTFEDNGRQGMSWVGGNSLVAIGSRFARTGRAVNIGLGSELASAPGAGVDVEAESSICRNGMFLECEFADNSGAGLVSHSASDNANFSAHRCRFIGTTTWALWPNNPGWKFYDSVIAGGMTNPYNDDADPDKSAQFYNCRFTGDTSLSETGTLYVNNYTVAEFTAATALFQNCHFDDAAATGSQGSLYAGAGRFRDCSFVNTSGNLILRATLEGYTKVTNTGGYDNSGQVRRGHLVYNGTDYGPDEYKVSDKVVLTTQQAAVADAAEAAAAPTKAEFDALVAQFNAWLAAARAHGLIAT